MSSIGQTWSKPISWSRELRTKRNVTRFLTFSRTNLILKSSSKQRIWIWRRPPLKLWLMWELWINTSTVKVRSKKFSEIESFQSFCWILIETGSEVLIYVFHDYSYYFLSWNKIFKSVTTWLIVRSFHEYQKLPFDFSEYLWKMRVYQLIRCEWNHFI